MRKRRYRSILAGCLAAGLSLICPFASLAGLRNTAAQSSGRILWTSAYVDAGPGAARPVEATGADGPAAALFDGGQLALLSSQTGAQMLSVVMQSKEGGLIVVDGGWTGDADHLLQAIRDRGGHVDAWLITHPDADHVGALYAILQRQDTGIAVDHIYIALAPLEWYQRESAEDYDFVSALAAELAKLPEATVVPVTTRGMQIQAPGITVSVVNNIKFGSYGSRSINNSSVLYRVEMNGVRTLFLGDLSDPVDEELLREVPAEDLKADIVQMAHHGQAGVCREVYAAIDPSVCLWPTPAWLWDNDNGGGYNSGSWKTLEVRTWMWALGVDRNYTNKDGDVILR